MKYFLKFGLPALLASSAAFTAAIPAEGWYAGLFGLGSSFPSTNFNLTPAEVNNINNSINAYNAMIPFFSVPRPLAVPLLMNGHGKIKYSFGGGIGGQVGYRWCGFRLEGELLYNYDGLKEFSVGGITFSKKQRTTTIVSGIANNTVVVTNPYTINGHTQLGAGLINVFYDFYDFDADEISFYPYVGLGVGYAKANNKVTINYNATNPVNRQVLQTKLLEVTGNDSTAIGQAIVGVGFQLDDNFSLFLDYRYLTTRRLKVINERLTLNTINLGFNYWFNT